VRRFGLTWGDAWTKKWGLGLVKERGDDDGTTFEDSIFLSVAVLDLRHKQLRTDSEKGRFGALKASKSMESF